MTFGIIILNQSIKKMQNYVIWILTALLFILKLKEFYEDIADYVVKWFDTSNYSEDDKRPLTRAKNKKVIGLFMSELGGKIITKFVALRAKTYSYVINDNVVHKKAKGTKKCVIKRILQFS